MNILVSACLLGVPCRHDGLSKANPSVLQLAKVATLIPICPEQLGGLPTPREAAERVGSSVLTKEGCDVSACFYKSALEALRIAQLCDCKIALLKENSPSCGSNGIYDGTFTQNLIVGKGVTAALLEQKGIEVYGESQVQDLLMKLNN